MKKLIAFLLVLSTIAMCACSAAPVETTPATTEPAIDYTASAEEAAVLEKLYEGRVAYHGDIHCHTQSGEKSDGMLPLSMWADAMAAKKVDFIAVADHRQTSHYRHEAWDDALFIGASEGGMRITSVNPEKEPQYSHTNYIFPTVEGMEDFLQAFPLYFTFNSYTSHYKDWGSGNTFPREVAQEVASYILDHGGFFVLVHPTSPAERESPKSGELMDYWLVDGTGFEVFFGYYGPSENYEGTKQAYELWKQLLAAGKKIYATAGSDTHTNPYIDALSTIYVAERSAQNYIDCLRAGDFTPCPIGIRMTVGDTLMGGQGSFEGEKVIFSVGDFHESVLEKYKNFRVVLLDDSGEVFRQDFTAEQTAYFAVEANKDAKFYRVEIYDADKDLLIGIGNPIWNKAN